MNIRVTRLASGPIIGPYLHPSIGVNIQGPSLIRVPDWIDGRLGGYYLYFADHKGSYIRLAYADHLAGPWRVHPPGSLHLAQSRFLTAPPAVSADELARFESQYRARAMTISHDVLSEITTDDADRAYTPGGPMPKEFRGHLTLNISNDGLVYAADRMANRIQVTTKQGKFVKEFILAPTTGVGGSTCGVMFSPDKQQRLLYISDLTNNHIWFLNREDGKVVGQMGTMGENGGQFYGLHMIAVDSKGNIYTGEVFAGERVQRFVPVK